MSPQTMSALIMLPSFHGISWSLSKQVLRNNNLITLQATHRDMAKPAKDRTHWDMSRARGRENLTIYVLKIYCWKKKTVSPTVRSAAANSELPGLQAGLLLPLPILLVRNFLRLFGAAQWLQRTMPFRMDRMGCLSCPSAQLQLPAALHSRTEVPLSIQEHV